MEAPLVVGAVVGRRSSGQKHRLVAVERLLRRLGRFLPTSGGGGEKPRDIGRIGRKYPLNRGTKWPRRKTGVELTRGSAAQGNDGDPLGIPWYQTSPK